VTPWQEVGLIVGMVLVTVIVRFPVLLLAGRLRLPPALKRALRYVPVAVLSAISVPILLLSEGKLAVTPTNEYLVAGLLAIVIAAVSRHLLMTIIAGMAIFIVLRLAL